MDNSTIGIKIADGTYYPVIEGDSKKKKKLILTTVNDDQDSVQIDLYKGAGQVLADALYIGSLVIEDILPGMKGEPEIELILGVDAEGNMNAVAGDIGSADKQSLSVSLESLENREFDSPNFEIDDGFKDNDTEGDDHDDDVFGDQTVFDEVPALNEDDNIELDGFGNNDFEDESSGDDGFEDQTVFDEVSTLSEDEDFGEAAPFDDFESDTTFDEKSEPEENSFSSTENKKKRSPYALIVLIILIIAILGIGAFLVIRGLTGDSIPPLEAESAPSVEPAAEPAYTDPPAEEPVLTVVAEPELPAVTEPTKIVPIVKEPVTAQPVDSAASGVIPSEGHGGGVWYRLKWGDTLWDLSNSFYRNPWLYGIIAVENGIKNPDIIYAGTDLLIPEN